MKSIFICYYVFEIETSSTASIPRLLASFIGEVENDYKVLFFTFKKDYSDEYIRTTPEYISLHFSDRLWRKLSNSFYSKKKVTEFQLKRKSIFRRLKKINKKPDIIIVLGLDDVRILRKRFEESRIIYWIHGISAIYNKEYLRHINKIDRLWSPTTIVYKKIVDKLHPVPFLAEFKRIPNWAESYFDCADETAISIIQQHHKIAADSKVFIFCGGDNKLKGWFLIDHALQIIAKGNDADITVIVTGGTLKQDEFYGKRIRIIFAGRLDPKLLASYYRLAEFGLFPSLGGYEHAPVTLIEMIRSNVIPIASDVGGVREMVGEQYPFLIDTPHSVEAWRDSIENMIALSEEEKCQLLSFLHEKMNGYKRVNFKQLLQHIL